MKVYIYMRKESIYVFWYLQNTRKTWEIIEVANPNIGGVLLDTWKCKELQ